MSGQISTLSTQFYRTCRSWLFGGLPDRAADAFHLLPKLEQLCLNGDFEDSIHLASLKGIRELHLILSSQYAVKYSFEIPSVAGRDLRHSIFMEAERILPITLAKLHLAWRIRNTSDKEKKHVDVYAVRRSVIEQLEQAANKFGVTLGLLSVADEETDHWIEIELPSVSSRKWLIRLASVVLAGTIIGLFFIAPGIYLDRIRQHATELDAEIRSVRSSTRAVTMLQRQMRTMQSLAAEIHSQKEKGRITDLMVQLTAASPDDVVISEMRLDKNRLYLSGVASKPESWVIGLAENPAFEDVSLTSVSQGDSVSFQRFELRATVRWPQERQLP